MATQFYGVVILLVFLVFLNIFFPCKMFPDKRSSSSTVLCTAYANKQQEAAIMKGEDYFLANNRDESCALHTFKTRDVVACLEYLHRHSSRPWLHFAFIGDSRVRQQFYNLLKVGLSSVTYTSS